MKDILKDLTGEIFGKLTVIKRAEDYISPKGKHSPQWLCKCDCGNPDLIVVLGSNLKRGLTKSCGCLSKEIASMIHSKRNKFENLTNNITKVFFNNCNNFFICDTDEWGKINNTTWILDGSGYVYGVINNRQIRLHRLLMEIDNENYEVDHIDGNPLNNLKSNLRLCYHEENAMNQKISTKNTSGHVGVYWDASRNKWYATINVNKKRIYIGRYDNFEDAIKAREEAEERYHGEYSTANSRNGTYHALSLKETIEANTVAQSKKILKNFQKPIDKSF